jgi:putative sterol carrier protein
VRGAAAISNWLSHVGIGRGMDPAWLDAEGVRMIISSERAKTELGWRPRCPTAADVVARHQAEVPRHLDSRIAFFFRAVDRASRWRPAEDPRNNHRFHLRLTGRDGGDFTIAFENGRILARRGVPRPPEASLLLSTDTFRQLLQGRLDMTTAQLVGAVRLSGNPAAAMVLGGIITSFRAMGVRRGIGGAIAGRLIGWVSRTQPVHDSV